MARHSKSGGALKHATGRMKANYMNDYLDLSRQIKDEQSKISKNGYPIGSCGHELKNRPLWMVGKLDICFDCYEKRSNRERAAESIELAMILRRIEGIKRDLAELVSPEEMAVLLQGETDDPEYYWQMKLSETIAKRVKFGSPEWFARIREIEF